MTEFLIHRTPKYIISIPEQVEIFGKNNVCALNVLYLQFSMAMNDFLLTKDSVHFLHNRHLEPQWSNPINFDADKWVPDAKEHNIKSHGIRGCKFS